jgi:hypothetical protein
MAGLSKKSKLDINNLWAVAHPSREGGKQMRSTTNLLAIGLLVLGIVAVVYLAINYSSTEKEVNVIPFGGKKVESLELDVPKPAEGGS